MLARYTHPAAAPKDLNQNVGLCVCCMLVCVAAAGSMHDAHRRGNSKSEARGNASTSLLHRTLRRKSASSRRPTPHAEGTGKPSSVDSNFSHSASRRLHRTKFRKGCPLCKGPAKRVVRLLGKLINTKVSVGSYKMQIDVLF